MKKRVVRWGVVLVALVFAAPVFLTAHAQDGGSVELPEETAQLIH